MKPELGPEVAAVEVALVEWRRKAADVTLAALVAVQLPAFVLLIIGSGPPMGWLVRAACIISYLVLAAAAVLRGVEYRTRLRAFFFAGYLAIAVANVTLPRGLFVQVGLITLPTLVLVFFGAPAARRAILACVVILVSAPLLRVLPGVARTLTIDPIEVAGPPGLVWMQAAVLAAFLVALMILLDRFHQFLLHSLAAQCRVTTELEREAAERSAAQRKLEDEMRERERLEREIAGIGDSERRRLGQELQSGICQRVTAALLRCQALERRLERGGELSSADFEALSSLLTETISEAQNVALGLCPLEPDSEALAPALRMLTKRLWEMSAVRCEFLAVGDLRVSDPTVAQHLYRIAQEALGNAVRHAHANRIAVELRGSNEELLLQVEDDGAGLPVELPVEGMGLRTMAYRAQILGSDFAITSTPGGGTRVTCRLPRLAGASAALHASGAQLWIPTMDPNSLTASEEDRTAP
jgi:signal transduction histidine kinase